MVVWLALLLTWVAAAPAQEPAAILAPLEGTTVAPGQVRIIARAPGKATVTVDGKVVAVTEPVPGVVHAEVSLAEGKHDVTVSGGGSEAKISFQAGKPAPGTGFRAHPPGLMACDTCHAVKADAWALKRITLAPLCGQCHDRSKFVATHSPHNTDILADCQNCHLPHGSAAHAHLQKPKAVVCKSCHN